MEQPAIGAREQKILKAKYLKIVTAKYSLFLVAFLVFICIGLVLGSLIDDQQSIDINGASETIYVTNWKTVAFFPIVFILMYLNHKFQRGLSGRINKNNRSLIWDDRCFFVFTFIPFCLAVAFGCVGATLSMDNLP